MKRTIAKTLFLVMTLFMLSTQSVADINVSIEFSSGEISIIQNWYRDYGIPTASHGKGEKKSKGLPPGISKNLARGKPLPPGIAKQHLPESLRSALPTPRAGYERIIVDGKVLLVEIATQVIHDMLEDVILR